MHRLPIFKPRLCLLPCVQILLTIFALGKEVFIMMTEATKAAHVNEAKGLAKWFKVEFTISIFGHVILHWEYPPQSEE